MSANLEKEGYIAELLAKMIKSELTPEESSVLYSWRERSAENNKVFEEVSGIDSLMEALENLYRFKQKIGNRVAS
jgi:hypothetical protein